MERAKTFGAVRVEEVWSPDLAAADVAARLAQHYARGADHVAVQLLPRPGPAPVDDYREFARALGSTGWVT